MSKRKKLATADAVHILYRRYYEGRPERVKKLDEARANDSVARKLTALRLRAGMIQRSSNPIQHRKRLPFIVRIFQPANS